MKRLDRRRVEAVLFLLFFFSFFGILGHFMGIQNMISTMMKTAYALLVDTVLYIMAVSVLAGALGRLLIEFGVVRLLEGVLAPFMKPLFNLPGVASLGGLMTFFSDNPAIISLVNDRNFSSYFKKYQLISLTNFGTAFGMGLVVISFMIGKGFVTAALVGFSGAVVGAMVSTRIMQKMIKGKVEEDETVSVRGDEERISFRSRGSVFLRFINSILDGGKSGVDLGLAIIPGVLIISTLIMMVTFGQPAGGYTGAAFEGVPLLPRIANLFGWLFKALFGFHSPEAIAFPMTSLGAVGAALSLIPTFMAKGMAGGNEIAVFTAMGMCWSGYLSTHTAMLDALKHRELTSKALLAHTAGGIAAGVFAHYAYLLVSWLL
ncbi:MAG TPA: hypothetical protein PLF44_06270 [Candidatus Mcinerneyibacteriales bacterium]|nr:hypothetical protein [Candidatus Mcinerneyibacteriales bacterium]HPE20969.1 hypothetical protein [Candidatus Mcinerneyibacteriales bacterium]HPJ70466.1 hypothetical protein [Candidatus Mcinerneyibacteriales bacterium]HPQ89475.1 hypothetical protein [Candidatus Mcinerneyibacteriales bacterium]